MRYYKIGNQIMPSVTTVLGVIRRPYLERWRGELGNVEADRRLNEAGTLGANIHDICQAINLRQPWEAPDKNTELMARAYEKWYNQAVKTVVAVEKVVVSAKYGYAGRLDFLARLRGDRLPTLIDVKTGKRVYREIPLQLAAYKHSLEEFGRPVARRLVVHLDKQEPGKLHVYEYVDHERDFRMFLYALELWRYFFGDYAPKEEEIVTIRRDDCFGYPVTTSA